MRLPLILAGGALEGGSLGYFWRTRYRSGFHYLCWTNRIWTPFMLLIFGADGFVWFSVFLVIVGGAAAMDWLTRDTLVRDIDLPKPDAELPMT